MGIIFMLSKLFYKLGYIPKEKLNFGFSVGKRLDEHREEVESIANSTDYFQQSDWKIGHFAIQDDYLIRLYHLVHGCWPDDTTRTQSTGEHVRPRPKILGACGLPEYKSIA